MTALYLLEPDEPGAAWAPFAGVRPIAELRAGLWRIRERWERALGLPARGILGQHCDGFREADAPGCTPSCSVPGPAVVAASWFVPTTRRVRIQAGTRRLVHGDTTVAWVVSGGESLDDVRERGPTAVLEGLLLPGTYGLLDALERLLAEDCAELLTAPSAVRPSRALVLGDPAHAVSLGAEVEPGVLFDVRHGPVVVDAAAEVRHGTRLEGPVYVGSRTRVLGGDIRGSVFGPECRLRGEIASSVFLGYANKSHEGFVGHSVVGAWVNLGAGTTTSNLKNTYGPVRLELAGERIETGRLNVGSFFGDHAKTAIGTMLGTGTVVSAGANIFGPGQLPKYVPPFAWGLDGGRMSEEGFLTVAERVMARRQVSLTPEQREFLRKSYGRAVRA